MLKTKFTKGYNCSKLKSALTVQTTMHIQC